MGREIGAAFVALVMLSGCDQAGRAEIEEMRAELATQAERQAAQQAQITALEAALAEERAARVRGEAEQRRQAPVEAGEPTPNPVLTPTCVDGRCVVQRAELEALFASPSAIMRTARIVPVIKEGTTQGFKLYAIRAGSPPALLGLKNGDLVRSLGGLPLDGAEAALTAYEAVRGRDRWEIGGLRGDQPFEILIEIR